MPLMDSLHIALGLAPLATYLFVLGTINLSRRSLVVSGSRDAAGLAIALSGLVIIGPLELFLVEEAAVLYGVWVWGIMIAAYALTAVLVILILRPRLVVYNITLDQLRPMLADVVARLDSEARWAGESLVMPQLGVQLHLDANVPFANVQLVSSGPVQNIHGWKQLEVELRHALRKSRHRGNLFGAAAIMISLLMAAGISYVLARDPAGVLQALNEMLRR